MKGKNPRYPLKGCCLSPGADLYLGSKDKVAVIDENQSPVAQLVAYSPCYLTYPTPFMRGRPIQCQM